MINTKISLRHIQKRYNGRDLFAPSLNVDISSGDKFVIVGPSGVGKSTILNMIMGFVIPDSGDISYNSELLSKKAITRFRAHSAYIPQSLDFKKSIGVREFIDIPFKFKVNKLIVPNESEILYLMDKLMLKHELLNSVYNDLSGGEKQRFVTLIALLLKRDVYIMDEPTSNLDSESSSRLIKLIEESDKTFIISSHDINLRSISTNLLELK
ncbi:hypothetical protein MASR1M45_24440 [Candidatus Kapaibacterium sp.]